MVNFNSNDKFIEYFRQLRKSTFIYTLSSFTNCGNEMRNVYIYIYIYPTLETSLECRELRAAGR